MQLDLDTCELVISAHRKHGATTFGKIAQSLIAITLHSLDWKNIRNHLSEDADLDAISGEDRKYTLEIKTSVFPDLNIQDKDIVSLQQRKIDGYNGYFTVMRVGKQAEWFATPYTAEKFPVGKIPFVHFRMLRDVALSDLLNHRFPDILSNHYEDINKYGLPGLRKIMDRMGIESVE